MSFELPPRRSSRIKTKQAEHAKLVEQQKRKAEDEMEIIQLLKKTVVTKKKPVKNKSVSKSKKLKENEFESEINKFEGNENKSVSNSISETKNLKPKPMKFNPLAAVFVPGVALHPISVYKRKSVRKSRIIEPAQEQSKNLANTKKSLSKNETSKSKNSKPKSSKPKTSRPKTTKQVQRSPLKQLKRGSKRLSSLQTKQIPEDWGISIGSDIEPFEETDANISDELIKLPTTSKSKKTQSKKTSVDKENSNPNENDSVESTSKSTAKSKPQSKPKSKKPPVLTEAQLQELAQLKQKVLSLVKSVAIRNNREHTLQNPDKPIFELPKITKWAVNNIKTCQPTNPIKIRG